ncbi:unnamed protein product [Alopecurus aequalis]
MLPEVEISQPVCWSGTFAGTAEDVTIAFVVFYTHSFLKQGCIHLQLRPDDLRRPFGQFGRLKDVYIPRDYHTQEPRGFGFVQYFDPADAADAKYYMDGQVVLGREIAVVFAQENRKKPDEMRTRESSRGRSYDRRYSPSPRGRQSYRGRSHSRSPSPRYARRRYREESYSRSPADSRSRSPTPSDRHYSRSVRRERSVSVSG